MAKDFSTMEDSNRSANPSIHALSDPARRVVLRGGIAAALAPLLAGCAGGAGWRAASTAALTLGFESVRASTADSLVVAGAQPGLGALGVAAGAGHPVFGRGLRPVLPAD